MRHEGPISEHILSITTKIKIYDASFLGAFIKRHYLVNNWMCNGAY